MLWYMIKDRIPWYIIQNIEYNTTYIDIQIHRDENTKHKTQKTNKHNNKNKQTQKLNVNNEPTTENPM